MTIHWPKATTIVAIIVLAMATIEPAQAQRKLTQDEIQQVLREIDQLYRSSSSESRVEMEIITPHWQRTLELKGWSQGTDKTFMRILSPKKEAGVATLRIDNEMWNYLPKTNKVIKIPPSMMMSSWMGSDFTNDDLVKEFSLFEDYTYESVVPEDADTGLVYVNCIPREDLPIVWGNILIAARMADTIPIWQKYYDEKGNLMRTLLYEEIKEMGGRRIPSVMEMVPENKDGHKTIVRYKELAFDVRVEDRIFSLRNLRAGR